MREDVPFTYRPIDAWPGEETPDRRRAPFDAGWGQTLNLLLKELRMLDAEMIVCQVALRERDFRTTDGHPKSRAVASHPGVILAFDSKFGPLKYACDTFDAFDDNMRAIALGLEALRKVERYGITKRGEQYQGWKALPPGTVMGARMTKAEAVRVLVDLSGLELDEDDPASVLRAFKRAAKKAHPDRGGSDAQVTAAVEARDVLINGD